MTCKNAATGARVSHWYVEEVNCGITPANPAWKPIRFTGGNIRLTKDSIQSAELDGSREVADLRLGQNQAGGEINVELAYASHDDLLEAALGGTWSTAVTGAGLTVTITSSNSRYTRTSGSFVSDGVVVGDLIKFSGFVNAANNGVFRVKTVTASYVAVVDANSVLVDESGITAGYTTSTKLQVGTTRRSFSILTNYADADAGAGEYHITTGCEITAYSFDCSVNAMVTGSFTVIGREYLPDTTLPSGSTFSTPTKNEVFASIDGSITESTNSTILGYVTSFSFSLDNAATAQFAVGNDYAAFIEQGRANSTLSLATFFMDSTLLSKFVTEEESKTTLFLSGDDGAMSFRFPRIVYTSGAPELSGEGSITQTLEAQALKPASATETSIEIRRIA